MTDKLLEDSTVLTLAAEIVSAFVSNNAVQAGELPELITDVHAALRNITQPSAVPATAAALKPAVSIKRSVTPEYLICLEDGKKFKSLKRHLRTHYNLSPDQYRAKWALPPDYPMVAPGYARERSQLAKETGLGQQRRLKR